MNIVHPYGDLDDHVYTSNPDRFIAHVMCNMPGCFSGRRLYSLGADQTKVCDSCSGTKHSPVPLTELWEKV
jgi:hypothetical protein